MASAATSSASLGCSTITFRTRPLDLALDTISSLGFHEIDLGAIPSVVSHVPLPLDAAQKEQIVRVVTTSNLTVRTVNSDPGPLNELRLNTSQFDASVEALIALTATLNAALIVPCGGPSIEPIDDLATDIDRIADQLHRIAEIATPLGVRVLVEAPHVFRLCNTVERAEALLEKVDSSVAGLVFDVSHVVASGADPCAWVRRVVNRIEHVQLRDARLGDVNLSIGRGEVDFAAVIGTLSKEGYQGHYSLELETHDISDAERPSATADARDKMSAMINAR